MSPEIINVGASPNDGQGDPIRTAFIKTNSNFARLFALPNSTPPSTLVGKAGDVPGMYAYNADYFYYCFAAWNGTSIVWAQVAQVNDVSVNKINNGNSNVSIAGANANVTVTVNSVANVATFSTDGLSVNGNITGNYYIGNGSQLTGIVGDYSNANVTSFLPTYSGNIGTLTAVGNVETISFFVGDGSQLSNISAANIVGAYSNANVANYLPTYSGNITAGNISVAGNVNTGYFVGSGQYLDLSTMVATSNIGTPGVGGSIGNINLAGNITFTPYLGSMVWNGGASHLDFTQYGHVDLVGSDLNVYGNITAETGNYFIGDGSLLTNLPAGSYSNANVAAYLPTYTGDITANVISTTGNVYTSGYFVGNFEGNISGNIVVPGLNTQVLYNNNGNADASAGLTFDATSNVLATTGNISTTGNVIAVSIYTSGVVSAAGNVRGSNFNTTGIVSATGNVYGNYFVGNITGSVANAVFANIANVAYSVDGANVSGAVANATYANTAGVAYSVSGANVTGNVANSTFATTSGSSTTAATVTTNAQPNITSVGTLTTLSVTGDVTANNVIANSFVTSNGFFKLPSYTTVQIGALTGMTGGEMVYNSDLQLVQGYQLNPATSTMGWVSWTVAVYQ